MDRNLTRDVVDTMARKNPGNIKVESPTPRNYLAVAMRKRYGSTTRIMKDRRAPRGGAKRPNHTEGW